MSANINCQLRFFLSQPREPVVPERIALKKPSECNHPPGLKPDVLLPDDQWQLIDLGLLDLPGGGEEGGAG